MAHANRVIRYLLATVLLTGLLLLVGGPAAAATPAFSAISAAETAAPQAGGATVTLASPLPEAAPLPDSLVWMVSLLALAAFYYVARTVIARQRRELELLKRL